jgi:hypothetical protein
MVVDGVRRLRRSSRAQSFRISWVSTRYPSDDQMTDDYYVDSMEEHSMMWAGFLDSLDEACVLLFGGGK